MFTCDSRYYTSFVEDLAATCLASGQTLSHACLEEASSRASKVPRGEWPRGKRISQTTSGDFKTSRLTRIFNVFPYGRNIEDVVSTLMEKDRKESMKRATPSCIINPR